MESKSYYQEKHISLLSAITSEASYKRKLFGYAILIQEDKQRTFSLSQPMNHHSSIYEENYMDGDFENLKPLIWLELILE